MSTQHKLDIEELKGSDLTTVIQQQKSLIAEIIEDVDRLLELSPVLQEKLREEVGLTASPDYNALTGSLEKLVGVSTPRQNASRRASAPGGERKAPRYALQRKSTGELVHDENDAPIAFRTKLSVLRGAKYPNLLGEQGFEDVQLIDTQDNNKVAVSELTFGPAPGSRR